MIRIDEIKNPDFLKKMSISELEKLSVDMRNYIIQNVSKTGGHLSSNLGIVDLTIAMLKVFDASKDTIIFDVGHQCYPYKILTGRASMFSTLRKKDGLSGFQSIKESIYDKYEAGHSSTSISAGLGFSLSNKIDNKRNNVISVIGDGSISNGLAFEALNQLGNIKTKQIVILNDNQMSISQNVGAIHNMLDSIRSGDNYNKAKENTKSILNKTKLGRGIAGIIEKIKNNAKKIYLRKASLFDDFGIEYYGPINGHDFSELIRYLNIAKKQNNSVILHVITQKGKGYKYAEEDKCGKFHGIGPFDIETGEVNVKNSLPSFSEVISNYVLNYAKKDKSIFCITPGMSYGSKLDKIKEKLQDQFMDVGIAEEHALVCASGMALASKKPIVFIYSTFLQRGYDALVHDIARLDAGVVLCIDRCGLVPGDGVSHQGVFDIPFMMHIPNMIISMPKDSYEANCLLYTAISTNHPFAIRYPKINIEKSNDKPNLLKIGSWQEIKSGKDGTIISYGDFVNRALLVADKLKEKGIDLSVVNARFIKPYDKAMFKEILKKNKPIFVYEESMKIGSLGNTLLLDENSSNSKIVIYAIEDKFQTHASREELIKMNKLDEDSIVKEIGSFYDNN